MAEKEQSTTPKNARERAVAAAARAKALRERAAAAKERTAVGRSLGGFMDFVRTQGVIGLAVGLAIGTQASELVKTIVGSVITPIVDLLVGKDGLDGLSWTLEVGDRTGVFTFGTLIDALIRFLAIAFVIYFVVKGFKLDRLDKKKEEK